MSPRADIELGFKSYLTPPRRAALLMLSGPFEVDAVIEFVREAYTAGYTQCHFTEASDRQCEAMNAPGWRQSKMTQEEIERARAVSPIATARAARWRERMRRFFAWQ